MFDPSWNAFLQRFQSPALDWFFEFWTVAGYAPVIVGILCVVGWTRDQRAAFGMIHLVLLTSMAGHLIKELVQSPRPFQVDPAHVQLLDVLMRRGIHEDGLIWAMPAQTSYSFPSGHAQMAICFWGVMALWARRWSMTLLAVVAGLLICLSRVYLGAHFVGDVAGGLVLGGAGLGIYALCSRRREEADPFPIAGSLPSEKGPPRYFGGYSPDDARQASRFPSPTLKIALALALPPAIYLVRPDPAQARTAFFLIGFTLGWLVEKRGVRFVEDGSASLRFWRAVLGLAVIAVAGLPFDRLLGGEYLHTHLLVWNAARFFLIGLVISLVVPWLFVRMGLARAL